VAVAATPFSPSAGSPPAHAARSTPLGGRLAPSGGAAHHHCACFHRSAVTHACFDKAVLTSG